MELNDEKKSLTTSIFNKHIAFECAKLQQFGAITNYEQHIFNDMLCKGYHNSRHNSVCFAIQSSFFCPLEVDFLILHHNIYVFFFICMDYLFLAIGLTLLLLGANYLVEASVAIAKRANISNFIIGLTIVGIGTSAPELLISISSAISGSGDIAMGNVIGSNICNTFLILGVTGLILPFPIEREQRRRDIPFSIFIAILLLALANDAVLPGISDNTMSRIDGLLLLLIFVGYMCFVIIGKGRNPEQAIADSDEAAKSSLIGKNIALLWGIAVVSLAALLYGGTLFLDAAKSIAKA